MVPLAILGPKHLSRARTPRVQMPKTKINMLISFLRVVKRGLVSSSVIPLVRSLTKKTSFLQSLLLQRISSLWYTTTEKNLSTSLAFGVVISHYSCYGICVALRTNIERHFGRRVISPQVGHGLHFAGGSCHIIRLWRIITLSWLKFWRQLQQ